MPTWLTVIMTALATVAVLALLWIGGELHRQSCLSDHSATVTGNFTLPAKAGNPGKVDGVITHTSGRGCSRKPF